jgi:exodeoxyribonuclease VII large subunit
VDQLREGQDLRAVLADGEADLTVGRVVRRDV